MKILYVDLEYSYGVKAQGPNYTGQDGFKKSFEKLGHHVVPFYYDKYVRGQEGFKKLFEKLGYRVAPSWYDKYVNYPPTALQNDLKNLANTIKPNLIFIQLFTNQFSIATLAHLKSKYTTVAWFGDDQWRFENFTLQYANHFTYCITTDWYAIAKYKQLDIANVIYSQWAAIDSHQTPEFHGYQYDVTFVGRFHPYRQWFIETLRSKGISVAIFGHGWPNGPLTANEMNAIFAASKINLNISNSTSFDSRYLLSGIKPLVYTILSTKTSSQTKSRNFEIPFFNGFQLTDYVPSLEQYFDIGKEVACYKDVEESAKLIKFYLENNDERESIKKAGHRRAISEHGYTHRMEEILKTIENKSRVHSAPAI